MMPFTFLLVPFRLDISFFVEISLRHEVSVLLLTQRLHFKVVALLMHQSTHKKVKNEVFHNVSSLLLLNHALRWFARGLAVGYPR